MAIAPATERATAVVVTRYYPGLGFTVDVEEGRLRPGDNDDVYPTLKEALGAVGKSERRRPDHGRSHVLEALTRLGALLTGSNRSW